MFIGCETEVGPWMLLPPFASSRNMSVSGLAPGTSYLFQIRAFGEAGLTDWSDSHVTT